MANFDSIKIPKIPKNATHFINKDTYYILSDKWPNFEKYTIINDQHTRMDTQIE